MRFINILIRPGASVKHAVGNAIIATDTKTKRENEIEKRKTRKTNNPLHKFSINQTCALV